MRRRCFLHLGLHKTASSSAQQTFNASRTTLQENNIIFPLFKCVMPDGQIRQIANHSIPIFSLFCDKPNEYRMNINWNIKDTTKVNSAYLEQLRNAALGKMDLLISGEAISALPVTGLQKLSSELRQLGFDIYPFALIRSPYAFACSAFQQHVKQGSYLNILDMDDYNQVSNRETFLPKRAKLISKLLRHFGDSLRLYNFSEATSHRHGPVGYIVEKMDICRPDCLTYLRVNESKGNKWVRAKNISNRYFASNEKTLPFKASWSLNSTEFSNDNKFLLTESEFQAVKTQIDEENSMTGRLIGAEFVEESYEFSEPLTLKDWKLIYLEALLSR